MLQLKIEEKLKFAFSPDNHDVSHLPASVKSAKQTTDGHLTQLAQEMSAVFATLDTGIPGAYLIPVQKIKIKG